MICQLYGEIGFVAGRTQFTAIISLNSNHSICTVDRMTGHTLHGTIFTPEGIFRHGMSWSNFNLNWVIYMFLSLIGVTIQTQRRIYFFFTEKGS